MNTRTLVVAALLLTTLVATAQTAEARPRIRAGTFDVDWSNLLLFRQNSAPILDTAGNEVGTSSTSEFSFLTGVAPKYFVVDNVAVGVSLGFSLLNRNETVDFDNSDTNDVDRTISDTGVPVFLIGQYYFNVGEDRYLFGGAGLGWTFAGSREVPDANNPNITIESDLSGFAARLDAGMMFYLSRRVNLRATLTALYRNLNETQANPNGEDLERTSSTIDAGLSIGIGYSF